MENIRYTFKSGEVLLFRLYRAQLLFVRGQQLQVILVLLLSLVFQHLELRRTLFVLEYDQLSFDLGMAQTWF